MRRMREQQLAGWGAGPGVYRLASAMWFLALLWIVAPTPSIATDASATPAPGPVEVVSQRTATSKTVRHPDGTYTTSLHSGPIHFREGNGWEPIESEFVADAGAYAWHNKRNAFQVQFRDQLDGDFMRFQAAGDEAVTISFDGAARKAAQATGDKLSFADAFPGVDLRYRLLADGVKETLVLASADVPRRYRFVLAPVGDQRLHATRRPDGAWEFSTAKTADAAFILQAPYVDDSSSSTPKSVDQHPSSLGGVAKAPRAQQPPPSDRASSDAPDRAAAAVTDERLEIDGGPFAEGLVLGTSTADDAIPAAPPPLPPVVSAPASEPTAQSDPAADPRRDPVAMNVTREGRVYAVEIVIDDAWLRDPARTFPILIDPTITVPSSVEDAEIKASCSGCYLGPSERLPMGTDPSDIWRSAIQFDLGDIPAGASVTGASLKLYFYQACVYRTSGGWCGDGHTLNAHRMTAPWSLSSRSSDISFDSTVLASHNLPVDPPLQWMSWNITGTVQNWLAGSQSNFGLLLKRSDESQLNKSGPMPAGRRNSEPSIRPRLEVTYSGDGVDLLPIDSMRSNGADLSWTRVGAGVQFTKYELHRSPTARFTPSSSTLLVSIGDPALTSYRDTTARPGATFTYKVVVNGSPSGERTVTLPADGEAEMTLQPTPARGKQTRISSANQCENHGSNDRLRVGTDADGARRSLLSFNLRDVPVGASVSSATLSIWQYTGTSYSATINAHRLTSGWVEGTAFDSCAATDGATWLDRAEGGVLWATAGGDFEASPSASTTHQPNVIGWDSFNLTSLAQQWVNGTVPNHGVLLKYPDETLVAGRVIDYHADDFSVAPTLRPRLKLTYADGSHAQGPFVALSTPGPGAQVSGTAVAIAASASDDRRVDKVEFYVGAALIGTDTSTPYSVSWNSTSVANGSQTLTAKAFDDAGNTTTTPGTAVTVANSAPPTVSAPTAQMVYQDLVRGDLPRGHWRLGESSGTTAADASGYGVSGSYLGSPSLGATGALAGNGDTAVSFDAVDDHVSLGDNFDFAGNLPMSVEAWVYPTLNDSTTRRIVSKEYIDGGGLKQGWRLAIWNDASFGIFLSRYRDDLKDEVSSGPLPLNAWTHVVATYDGGTLRLYKNGVEVASAAAARALTDNPKPLFLAASPQGASPAGFFQGKLDEPAIYDAALSEEAIRAHYQTGLATISGLRGTATVSASASDDVAVSKVEFYSNNLRIGEDATAPYSVSWNTLDPNSPAYDGTHSLTAKVYDNHGQVTTSSATNVTVTNASGTRYLATYSSSAIPQALTYDPNAGSQDQHPVDVTVTNQSAETWTSSTVLRYRWYSPNPNPTVTSSGNLSLGADVSPGGQRTVRVNVEPPALSDGAQRGRYRLRFDLYHTSNGSWFADKGAKPLEQLVNVNRKSTASLGLEQWHHYAGEELGAGMQHLLNLGSGNSIVRWTPWEAPGRGLSTVLDLTYNALEKRNDSPAGNNFSLAISGLTRFGLPLDIHPNAADTLAGRTARYIEFSDGDGTLHRFEQKSGWGGSYWEEPAGVHLFLREDTSSQSKRWSFTRPDRVTFFFDADGYPTSIEDLNGNKISFTLQTVPAGESLGGPSKRITEVVDPAGNDPSPPPNRKFTIGYYSEAEAPTLAVRGKLKRITDHNGSALDFSYYDDGNLLRISQRGGTKADGSHLADRSYVFNYVVSGTNNPAIADPNARANPDPRTPNQSARLYSVRDPRGSETIFGWHLSGTAIRRLASLTDRAGNTSSYAYDTTNRVTTETAPLARVSSYAFDTDGKVTAITNPKNETTTVQWSADRVVTKVTEATGKYTEFAYNDNGYLTKQWDELRNRTELEYQNVAVDGSDVSGRWKTGRTIPHISQLVKKTEPKGTATNGDRPVVADLNGDGKTEITVFRPSNGHWYTHNGQTTQWGVAEDIPVPGNYDADAADEIAVYRPSNGTWYVLGVGNFSWGGSAEDIPVPADYNGDGQDEVAIFRPSSGRWYPLNDYSGTQWGEAGDIPVPGNYDADAAEEMAVFRPSTGTWHVLGGASTQWGMEGDIPVVADFSGNGQAELTVFRPSNGVWYTNGGDWPQYGMAGDIPVPGNYDEGDAGDEIAVYRPSGGTWYVKDVGTFSWGEPAVADDFQWQFQHDARGNLLKVFDPEGHPAGQVGTPTVYAYEGGANPNGNVASITDPNGNRTDFFDYDANGLATRVVDAKGQPTKFNHDDDGLLRWTQDPLHASYSGGDPRTYRSHLDYDSFQRLGLQSAPKSTSVECCPLIWSSAAYDANDNVTTQEAPHYGDGYPAAGSKTSTSYDAMDRPDLVTGPDTSADPAGERTGFLYDTAGRLTRVTSPKGTQTSSTANDFATFYGYDLLDRVVSETRYQVDGQGSITDTRKTHLCYDVAGDLRSVTAPRANVTGSIDCANPPSFTTRISYDDAHRPLTETDPLNRSRTVAYDANGNVRTSTNENGDVTTLEYDMRDLQVKTIEPFRIGRTLTTKLEYDAGGRMKREISPRAWDAAPEPKTTFTEYVTTYQYDTINQLTRLDLPTSTSYPQAHYLHRSYDANGNLAWTSEPVSTSDPAAVVVEKKTKLDHFDPGWIRASKDPAVARIHFDYTAEGWQRSRAPETALTGGELDPTRRMKWTYHNDGQPKEEGDPDGQPTTYSYDANNNSTLIVDSGGLVSPGATSLRVESTYNGFDELAKARQKSLAETNFRFTSYLYDQNGNVLEREDDGSETAAGGLISAGRKHDFVYDSADQLDVHTDRGLTSGCTDDTRRTHTFWPQGWDRDIIAARGLADCSFTTFQRSEHDHFLNGDLKTQTTKNGANTVLESHSLDYETAAGQYLNGHRVKDTFTLLGPNPGAPCRTSSCQATFGYDPQERLVSSDDGHGQQTAYTLDPAGNVTREVITGTGAATYDYAFGAGNQLQSVSAGGQLRDRFWYDREGNLDCVTTPDGLPSSCSPPTGQSVSAMLRADYGWDYLNRLERLRSFTTDGTSSTARISSDYLYDAFDRVQEQTEKHGPAGTPRKTSFSYLGLSAEASEEKHTVSGSLTTTKSYAYGAYGERVGMTNTPNGQSAQSYSYGANVHGDISLLLNSTGAATAAYGYRPYGDRDTGLFAGDTDDTNPLNPFRFNDKRFDSGSGSLDMGARRFAPDTGRFLQQDAFHSAVDDLDLVEEPLTQNRYGFAGGNPISFVEIDGHVFTDSIRRFVECRYSNLWTRAACKNTKKAADKAIDTTTYYSIEHFPTAVGFLIGPGKFLDAGAFALRRTPQTFRAALWNVRRWLGNTTGPGKWTPVRESMSARSAAYQARHTGSPEGFAYKVRGVKFDGYRRGALLETKGQGYAKWVQDGRFSLVFKGRERLLRQAELQTEAARGKRIIWYFAEREAAIATRRLLRGRYPQIRIRHRR